MSAIFITGTDTDVGKTVISAWLASHWQADYWKPIQSGLDGLTDSECVAAWSERPCWPEAYRLSTPASPHHAAAVAGLGITLDQLRLPTVGRLIVEGAGGVMTPINAQEVMLDLMAHLKLPVILVARTRLGTINHTLLSLQALRDRGIPVLGVVLNGCPKEAHLPATCSAITEHGQAAILDTLAPWHLVTPQALRQRQPAPALLSRLQQLASDPA